MTSIGFYGATAITSSEAVTMIAFSATLCQATAQLVEAELEAGDDTRMREARRPPLRPTRRLATDRTGSLDAERAQ